MMRAALPFSLEAMLYRARSWLALSSESPLVPPAVYLFRSSEALYESSDITKNLLLLVRLYGVAGANRQHSNDSNLNQWN